MMERIVLTTPAFDRRNTDPSKNYGIHGMELRYVLKGVKGATQFLVFTNIQLPHVHEERVGRPVSSIDYPMGADIGYHAMQPQYAGQEKMTKCAFVDGGCYYDGSGLAATEFIPLWVSGGDEAVWPMLEDKYIERFGGLDDGYTRYQTEVKK